MAVKLTSKGNVVGVVLLLTTSMAALAGGVASAQSAPTSAASASSAAAAAPSAAVIAHNAQGRMRSKIEGTTGDGRTVTGTFIPLRFKVKDGKVRARGLVNGVVHNENGSTSTFSVMRSLRLKNVNGVPATNARFGESCDILRLVLGPLDLDLLGLEVHLNRVVLTVVATPGPGNLLGNLLCSVVGLLDGGLGGDLGELTRLLNRILGVLRLGL